MSRAALRVLVGAAVAAAAAGCHRAAPPSAPVALEQEYGVRVESLRRTAGGYMLDFRFRVLDEDKARPLFDRDSRPYVLHARSGAKLLVPRSPKIGPMRARTGGAAAPAAAPSSD